MALKVNENTEARVYKVMENGRDVEKVAVSHAEVLSGGFRDFMGTANSKGNLVRSFSVSVPDHVADFLTENGIPVSHWDTGETVYNIVSFKINYSSGNDMWLPKIELKEGTDGAPILIREDTIHTLQAATFIDSLITARVVHGTYMNKPYTSLYLDRAGLTKMETEVDAYERDMFAGFGQDEPEELPF